MKAPGRMKQRMAVLLIAALCCSNLITYRYTADARTDISSEQLNEILSKASTEGMDYKDYLTKYDINRRPDKIINIEAENYVRSEGMEPITYIDYEGMEGVSVYTEEQGLIEYEVEIEDEGFYDISLLYYPVEGKSASIQRGIFIDGVLPFTQLSMVEFSRIWVNELSTWERDNRGNDLKPMQIEAPKWITGDLFDSEGYETRRLSVYFTEGKHTITLYSRREPMLLRRITLHNPKEIMNYAAVKEEYDSTGAIDTKDQLITIAAETANRKSSQMLYPSQDKSSPAIAPYSAKHLRNNSIGSNSSWRIVGQWLEWDFEVEQTGYYYITLHARQNFVRGIYTSRKVTIDGEVPFQELSDYGFRYHNTWHMSSFKDEDGEKYRFYLEAGKHTMRMEVVLGNFSEIIDEIHESVLDLNTIYRKVIRITGVEPDKYRDYNLEQSIPGLEGELRAVRDDLVASIDKLHTVAGTRSNREAVLTTMVEELNFLIGDVERFTKSLEAYKLDMSALGNWITQVLDQPLALDTIYIHSPNKAVPKVNNSLWDRFVHMIKTLIYSFLIDYNTIGNVDEDKEERKQITVWIGSGRDQANILKALIDESFTPDTNINVKLQLVDMSTLLQATLAGQGPDVAIQVANAMTVANGMQSGNDLPMNYGMRNAVVDLTRFSDLDEIKALFRESAMVPYEFDGHTFALPETESCLMMFYRKDILEELKLPVPRTWDEMKTALSVLYKNQMDLGMLPSEQVFSMLLYQNGGAYYNEDSTKSALSSDIAIRAFKAYCEYYTDYKLEREAPVDQRFRTGEAPIIIADYTLYNQLQVSAPDIKGLWGFTMVPGTIKEDGTVDYSVSGGGAATIMMEQSKDKEASWRFMKWWSSTDIQTRYGREMEALLGAAARYPTANIKAFDQLPWPSEDYQALKSQFEWIKGIPQVPGGYYSWRNVNNAFYKVVITEDKDKMQPREALMDYIRFINEEITFKRKEFGLQTSKP